MAAPAMNIIKAEPLTASAFAPFGDVIDAASAQKAYEINQGYTTRFHDLAKIDVHDGDGDVCVNIFRSTPMQAPITIRLMERHPLGSQAFIPLSGRPFLVVVAPPAQFESSRIRAFLAGADQGVNYAKGVWHHFSLALEAESDFLVIDRQGPGDNLDEVTFKPDEQITVEY